MTLSATLIVYVVDDDADVRDSIQWLLESVGLTVVTCADAQQFLDTYESGKSGCLVVDVRMPGISGLNLQKQLPNKFRVKIDFYLKENTNLLSLQIFR